MPTLYLVRHTKAAWPADAADDRARELTRKGRRQARRLGRLLSATDERPDLLVSSEAVRARQTAEGLLDGAAWSDAPPMRSSEALYRANPADVIRVVRTAAPSADAILAVGHEPTWSATVGRLMGEAQVSMPVGTGARIDLHVPEWRELTFGAGALRWMAPPRLVEGLRADKP
jgi:phosphohistidine phosphatase